MKVDIIEMEKVNEIEINKINKNIIPVIKVILLNYITDIGFTKNKFKLDTTYNLSKYIVKMNNKFNINETEFEVYVSGDEDFLMIYYNKFFLFNYNEVVLVYELDSNAFYLLDTIDIELKSKSILDDITLFKNNKKVKNIFLKRKLFKSVLYIKNLKDNKGAIQLLSNDIYSGLKMYVKLGKQENIDYLTHKFLYFLGDKVGKTNSFNSIKSVLALAKSINGYIGYRIDTACIVTMVDLSVEINGFIDDISKIVGDIKLNVKCKIRKKKQANKESDKVKKLIEDFFVVYKVNKLRGNCNIEAI